MAGRVYQLNCAEGDTTQNREASKARTTYLVKKEGHDTLSPSANRMLALVRGMTILRTNIGQRSLAPGAHSNGFYVPGAPFVDLQTTRSTHDHDRVWKQ